jgi:hypothetical protein
MHKRYQWHNQEVQKYKYKCEAYAADCEGKTRAPLSVISKLHFTGQSHEEMTRTKSLKRIPLQ